VHWLLWFRVLCCPVERMRNMPASTVKSSFSGMSYRYIVEWDGHTAVIRYVFEMRCADNIETGNEYLWTTQTSFLRHPDRWLGWGMGWYRKRQYRKMLSVGLG
jgi:hypothetical protein